MFSKITITPGNMSSLNLKKNNFSNMNKTEYNSFSLKDILKNNTFLTKEKIQKQLNEIKVDNPVNKFNFTDVYKENNSK